MEILFKNKSSCLLFLFALIFYLSDIFFIYAAVPIGKKARASSVENDQYKPENAIDKNLATRWSSGFSDPQWLEIDLGEPTEVTGAILNWSVYGNYNIQLSGDGKDWTAVYSNTEADGGIDDIYFKKTEARFIRILGNKRATEFGYSLNEVTIKGPDEEPLLTTSSSRRPDDAQNALDGDIATKWHSGFKDDQWLGIDFRGMKRFGGLVFVWDGDYAKAYEIAISDDGKKWSTAYATTNGKGGKEKIYFDQMDAQFIKIICKKSATGKGYGIKEIEIKSAEETATLQRYYEIAAQESPPGYYPRWLTKEQDYWTIVGVADDEKEVLLCEDGTIEPYKRGFSVMPFLYVDDKLITRNEATISQSLENDYLPIPSVKWDYKDAVMRLKLLVDGAPGESTAYVRYTVINNRKEELRGKLFLTIRPFQVYSPWQGEKDGGLSPINSVGYGNDIVEINKKNKIFLLTKPDNFGAQDGTYNVPHGFPEGDIVDIIKEGIVPKKSNAKAANGDASAVMEYGFKLNPSESKNYFVAIPLYEKNPDLNINMKPAELETKFNEILGKNIAYWESKVSIVKIDIPETDIINTLKSNIAYSLITRDGVVLEPGSRCYDKAWMRDGSIAGSALLKMGLNSEARDFINWFSGYQLDSGEIPPIIDTKAEDPLWEEKATNMHEFDSQGEFIYAILQYYHFTKDKQFLKDKLPNVVKALTYLEYLRNQRLTPEYEKGPGEKRIFYGILPPSRSHEGYWPCAYAYWDDFWALKGWKDAGTIARILERDDLADWADKEYADFKKCVYDSIKLVMDLRKISYIPGAADKGDFDSTSTAGAIVYCDELENLPQPQLNKTFDIYYDDVRGRSRPNAQYRFVPYELRSVSAFIYLGQKERALYLLRFMLKYRRPAGWNHFAEVVHNDLRFPTYIGDMPHTFVGAEYINGVRSLFVYESGEKLILASGIDPKWLSEGKGISLENFPTHYGEISYSIKKENSDLLKISVRGKTTAAPREGFIFKSPFKRKIKEVYVDGKKWTGFSDYEIIFYGLPVELDVYY